MYKLLRLLCALSLFVFLKCSTQEKCQVYVSVDWASPCLSEADQRGGSGPVLPCQQAPALTWRGHHWAWEGGSGSTPLKPLASLLSLMRKQPVLLVVSVMRPFIPRRLSWFILFQVLLGWLNNLLMAIVLVTTTLNLVHPTALVSQFQSLDSNLAPKSLGS